MTDEQDKQDETAEEKPKRRRARAKAKPAEETAAQGEAKAGDEAAEKKPTRSRARAKQQDDTEAATEAAKTEARAHEPEAAAPEAEGKAAEEKPTKPAPRRKRAADETPAAPPVVRAQAKYIRASARKARLVCEHIRGKDVDEARAILRYTPRAVARDWSKLLESAVANAEHNHELVGDDLRVVEAYADEGPTLKRYRPRAMGRATRIRKRTAHLTIKLTPKE